MNKEKAVALFKEFLKEKNAWEQFEKELNAKGRTFKDVLEIPEEMEFISGAFLWRDTEKGISFWQELDMLWGGVLYNAKCNDVIIKAIKGDGKAKKENNNA